MRIVITLLLISIGLFSCDPPPAKDQNMANAFNTDSLVSAWNAAWNKNDSAAIMDLFSTDIVFIGDGNILKGADSVGKIFVGPNSKVVKNLKTNLISSGSSGDQAYYYGSYTHDVALKDTVLKNRNGIFSFIYSKEQNHWKIKVADIQEKK